MAKNEKKLKVKKVKKEEQNGLFRLLKRLKFVKGSDSTINIVVFILMLFGTFTIISTDVGQTTSNANVVLTTFIKQSIIVILSYILMWMANRLFSFKWFAPLRIGAIGVILFSLGVTQIFAESGGSKAWIRLGPVSLQPSEFAKPFIIVLVASYIYLARGKSKNRMDLKELYGAPFATYVAMAILIVAQKDMGTLAIITMIFIMCIIVPEYRMLDKLKKGLATLFLAGAVFVGVFFVATDIGTDFIATTPFSHIATRIENFKNPYLDVYGNGYQPANALYGIANSNFWGRGIGGSARKFGYLTQADNDYIFAVLIEETGVFGLFGLVTLYVILFRRLIYFAFKTNVTEYRIVLLGNAMYLFMHFFLNVGGVTCLIPMTGVPLLFISSGGSSLMSISLMIGISQKIISLIKYEGK